jgi:hypothetical protein
MGVILPDGMTQKCLDDLASLFNDYADELLLEHGEPITHYAAAVMAFEIVRRQLHQTEALPFPQSGGSRNSCVP